MVNVVTLELGEKGRNLTWVFDVEIPYEDIKYIQRKIKEYAVKYPACTRQDLVLKMEESFSELSHTYRPQSFKMYVLNLKQIEIN